MSITGKRILVTGATGGLGRGVVPVLLRSGVHVLATFRSEERLHELMELCRGAEAPMQAFPCDLTDMGQVNGVYHRVREIGPVDGLVCLAGGWAGGHPVWTAPADELEAQFRLNVVSAFNVIRTFVPDMIEAGYGRVVTVGSRIAMKGRKNNAASAASKAALSTLTKALADESKGTGVAAYSIVPAMVATEANLAAFPRASHDRWVAPERIGEVIAWLLDDAAAIANGAVIPVYGDS